MTPLKKLLFLFAAMIFAVSVQAQKDFAKDADQQFENEAYYDAIELYKKAYSKSKKPSEKARILFRIAESYRKTTNSEQAEVWYRKAIKAEYDDPMAIFYLAQSLKSQGKYEEALKEFRNYKEKKPDDQRVAEEIEACKKGKEWMDEPSRYKVKAEVQLNSEKRDFSPAWGDSRNSSLIFTSDRESATGKDMSKITGNSFEDLFMAEVDRKGKWSVPNPLGETVNSEHHEGASVLGDRGRTMYFTRCKYDKKEGMKCNILKSEKKGQNWGEPTLLNFREEDDDSSTVGHPALAFNDQVMIFASDMAGGQGGKDLWMVKKEGRGTNATWGEPENLGSDINTDGDDMYPYVREDGTLFFASDGHLGMGGLDIFKAENVGSNEEEDCEWKNVENMKYPLNSPGHDFGIIFDGDEKRGYFTSDRSGGRGLDDIYNFKLPPLVFALKVKCYNKETNEPVPGASVKVVGTDGSSYEATTNEQGMVTFEEKGGERYIKPNTTYNIRVEKDKYLAGKDQITTVGVDESTTFFSEAPLQPTVTEDDKKVVIEFPEVRYAFNKAELQVTDSVNSKDSLDVLYQTLQDNPNIVIELQAHTDARGSDSYNKRLSQKRAESCVEYLRDKGIPAERMVPKGYGETRPRITLDEINQMKTEEEKEAAHQKNRRTEFIVLREDYVPKDQQEGAEQ